MDHATPSTQPITRVREGLGVVVGTFAEACHLADTMYCEQYVAYQMAQMPEELRSNPEYCLTIAGNYFLFKSFAKVEKAIRAADDATGNVGSWLLNKVGDLSRAVFGTAERGLKSLEIPDILVENPIDIAEVFAPGAAVKL